MTAGEEPGPGGKHFMVVEMRESEFLIVHVDVNLSQRGF